MHIDTRSMCTWNRFMSLKSMGTEEMGKMWQKKGKPSFLLITCSSISIPVPFRLRVNKHLNLNPISVYDLCIRNIISNKPVR